MIDIKKLPKIGTKVWIYFFNPNGKSTDRTPSASVQQRIFEGVSMKNGETFITCRKAEYEFSMSWPPERVFRTEVEAKTTLNLAIDTHIAALQSLRIP